jgi:hypothetical protein
MKRDYPKKEDRRPAVNKIIANKLMEIKKE